MPYLTGNKGSALCEVLLKSVPSDALFLAALRGAVSELGSQYAWEQYGSATPDDAALEFAEVLRQGIRCGGCTEGCPDCPDCPDCPNEAGTAVSGGGQLSPTLGIPIAILEDMMVSSIVDIRCNPETGVFEILRFGCCEYEELCGGTVKPYGTKPPSELGYDAWDGDGQPALPSFGSVHVGDPVLSQSTDAVRCIKAAALVAMLRERNDAFIDLIDAVSISGLGLGGILAWVAAGITTGGWAIVAGVAVEISIGLALVNLDDTKSDLQSISADDDGWNELECTLVTAIPYGNEITETDIGQAYYYAAQILEGWDGSGEKPSFRNLLGLLPISWQIGGAAELADDAECGCDDFLPASYVNPEPVNLFFEFYDLCRVLPNGDWNGNFVDYEGEVFAYPFDAQQGAVYQGSYFNTVQYGVSNGYNSVGGAVYVANQAFDITHIKVTLLNATAHNLALALRLIPYDSQGAVWYDQDIIYNSNPGAGQVQISYNLTDKSDVTAFALQAKGRDSNGYPVTYVSSIKISGSVGGNPFVDLEIATEL